MWVYIMIVVTPITKFRFSNNKIPSKDNKITMFWTINNIYHHQSKLTINNVLTNIYSPPKSVAFASRETILTKYIKIYIDIYGTKLISLDRYLNLVFYKIYSKTQMLHVFSTNPVKLVARKPTATLFWGRREYVTIAVWNISFYQRSW
jgi:hypothetical protein